MFILNFLKNKAAQAKRIRQLELLAYSTADELDRVDTLCIDRVDRCKQLEKENAELRRIVGGFKAGQTRRKNKEQETPCQP